MARPVLRRAGLSGRIRGNARLRAGDVRCSSSTSKRPTSTQTARPSSPKRSAYSGPAATSATPTATGPTITAATSCVRRASCSRSVWKSPDNVIRSLERDNERKEKLFDALAPTPNSSTSTRTGAGSSAFAPGGASSSARRCTSRTASSGPDTRTLAAAVVAREPWRAIVSAAAIGHQVAWDCADRNVPRKRPRLWNQADFW